MLFLLPLLLAFVLADDSGIGCYSSVDTSVSKGYQQYQTLSMCASSCGSNYPYVAITDGGTCYCLLSLPTSVTDSSNCNVKCNGYGSVMCGGTSAYTVFVGLGESSGSVSAASGSNLAGTSLSAGSSTLKPGSTLLSSSSLADSAATTKPSASTNSAGSSITANPESSNSVFTTVYTYTSSGENGSVIYKTVTSLSSASSSSKASGSSSSTKKSSNVGPIAGGVVGGLAALALIIVGIFFFLRRRDSDDDDDEEDFYEKGSGSLSRANGTSKSKKFDSTFDMPMTNPFAHPTDEFADKRTSKMTLIGLTDPRLNPAMMGRRRLSEASLADETDYSRKILAVANP